MNLVSNAIKFTHSGGITIRVSKESVGTQAEEVDLSIQVTDTGIGMSESTQLKVFDAFTQADASTTRQYGGTGLGLAISKKFVELMNGSISLVSEPGIGTTFTVRLCLKVAQAERPKETQYKGLSGIVICEDETKHEMVTAHLARLGIDTQSTQSWRIRPSNPATNSITVIEDTVLEEHPEILRFFGDKLKSFGIILASIDYCERVNKLPNWIVINKPVIFSEVSSAVSKIVQGMENRAGLALEYKSAAVAEQPRILVAEDVGTNQKIAEEVLAILGCHVDLASNGAQAIKLYSKNEYDLIFMDCQMPIMDGFVCTEKIRHHEHQTSRPRIPILALTAGNSSHDRKKCMEVGMDGFIAKPFTINEIKNAIEEHALCVLPEGKPHVAKNTYDFLPISGAEPNNDEPVTVNKRAVENILEVERRTGRRILPDVYRGFRSQMATKLSELEKSITANDTGATATAAHAIKSMCANIGAEHVRTIAAKLESNARAGDMDNPEQDYSEISSAYLVFSKAFEKLYISDPERGSIQIS
jgi:CheY-like chemotaxis protein/HPt (histidine-containing phosphotransfer) domain-containing protein